MRELFKVWKFFNQIKTFPKLFFFFNVVEDSLLNGNGVYLVADGIDTVSSIHVNDKLIGTTDNMFVRYKFDVKPVLKKGENKIVIAFESAVSYAQQKYEHYKTTYNNTLEGISLKKK